MTYNYYDLVLALIPLSFLTIGGGGILTGMGITTAVPLAGVIAMAIVGHAMFIRAPVDIPITQADPQAQNLSESPLSADNPSSPSPKRPTHAE